MDPTSELVIKQLLDQQSKISAELKLLNNRLSGVEKITGDLPTAETLLTEIKTDSEKQFTLTNVKPKRKRGRGFAPILESEIKEAQENSISGAMAARKLGVSYLTYRKYAKKYNMHTLINKTGKGISKTKNPNSGKYPLNDILDGKYPEYPIFRLKDRLIRANLKPARCEQCKFNERRVIDGKIPLLLVFEDGNSKNHRLHNIKILCYNCAFTSGKIWMKIKERENWLNDPDRIQGSKYNTVQKF